MKVLLSKTQYNKRKEFLLQTNIIKEKNNIVVEKVAWGDKSWESLVHIKNFYEHFSKRLPKDVRIAKLIEFNADKKCAKFEFIEGKTLEAIIEGHLLNKNFKEAAKEFKKAMEIIDSFSSRPSSDDLKNFEDFLGDYKGQIPKGTLDYFVPLAELTTDHIIIDNKGRYNIIDYENFFGLSFPISFVKFRCRFWLIFNLQQVIRSLGSPNFPLVTFSRDLYSPKIWKDLIPFSYEEKKLFLFIAERRHNCLNWKIVNMKNSLTKDKDNFDQRAYPKLTTWKMLDYLHCSEELNKIKDSKFFRLWRRYNKLKAIFKNE